MTTYQLWNRGLIAGFGSFHTTLLTAYRLADAGNRARLEAAFPDWFLDGNEEEYEPAPVKTIHNNQILTNDQN